MFSDIPVKLKELLFGMPSLEILPEDHFTS